jgi:YfiH family protein
MVTVGPSMGSTKIGATLKAMGVTVAISELVREVESGSRTAKPQFWRSELLASLPWCAHGVSQRRGGVSTGPYDSLNLGLHVGDDPVLVRDNRQCAAEALGWDASSMVCAAQVHGTEVALVESTACGRGVSEYDDAIPDTDSLITNNSGVLLTLFFADCFPVIFADPTHRAVGVAHAGWRGTVDGVAENTIHAMAMAFGTRPEDLRVAIGPGIRTCCFSVGDEVSAKFPVKVCSRRDGANFVDLAEALNRRLLAAGVDPEHIETCRHCTVCRPDLYFSHRRDGGVSGRMAAFVGIDR